MTRISKRQRFLHHRATVTGTAGNAPPRPHPSVGGVARATSPPEQAASIKGAMATNGVPGPKKRR
jgi:hypothetical protein